MDTITQSFYFDFLQYYQRAKRLQEVRLKFDSHVPVDDLLMESIPIYDTVERRFAGFSNLPQQLWHGSRNPKTWQIKKEYDVLPKRWTIREWLYVFLVHRVTGSGASFQEDHGFRNSILPDLANCDNVEEMVSMIRACDVAMFTSIGNQPPPFPKPQPPYLTGGKYYLCEIAPMLMTDLIYIDHFKTIRECVDWILDWHISHNLKRYKFVLTAFAMDIAEYFPYIVPNNSTCYYGSNCIKSMRLMGSSSLKDQDRLMFLLCSTLLAKPMDMEDVLCDYVRYLNEYIPKGYKFYPNNSLLKGIYGSNYETEIRKALLHQPDGRLQPG